MGSATFVADPSTPVISYTALQRFSACLFYAWALGAVEAQESQTQSTPLSTYLDLRPASPGAGPQHTPDWIESFEFTPPADGVGNRNTTAAPTGMLTMASAETTKSYRLETGTSGMLSLTTNFVDKSKAVFRIRLQRPVGATNYLQVRVFFDDTRTGVRPRLTVWNELGSELMQSAPLGQGLGIPSSETMLVPMKGADYLEIETTGSGSHVRGVFLSWLGSTRVLQPVDFPSGELVREPFGNLAATRPSHDDTSLYGVVTAPLQDEKPVVLKRTSAPGVTFQFELERRPLMAILTYEVLGTTVGAPPSVVVNGQPQGDSELHMPDLADPGYRGESEEGKGQMGFRYTGWVHAQKIVPADALVTGLNSLSLELSNGSKSIAIRSVAIQLKYDWEKLDYILSPAPVPHETP